MPQNSKIRGLRPILTAFFLVASITMPRSVLLSQPVTEQKQWVVVIDPGHGGKDPGAIGSRAREKNINLAVALKTGSYITRYLDDVRVIYTRSDDTFIGLAERAEVANRNKADLFISIHSNAMDDKRFSGAETYVLGHTNDEANLKVAMKENSVITFEQDYQTKYEGFDPNSAESYIIFSLMQNTYLKQSTEFATLLQNQFRDRVGRKDRGVRQAGFQVLRENAMPSVLVELAFITNPEEEKFLMSEQGQDYMASAIFRAFRDYKQAIDSRSGIRNGSATAAGAAAPTAVTNAPPAGTTTAPAGTTNASAGTTNASAGTTNASAGTTNASAGTTNASAGTTNTPAGTAIAPAATGAVADPSAAGQQAVTGKATAGDGSGAAAVRQQEAGHQADQIFFMVQVAAMPAGKELSKSFLSGLDPLTVIEDGERIKYAAGKFVIYDEALQHRRKLTARYPDAFVIAVRNGRIIPLREAIEAQKRK